MKQMHGGVGSNRAPTWLACAMAGWLGGCGSADARVEITPPRSEASESTPPGIVVDFAGDPSQIQALDIVAPGYRLSAFRFDPASGFDVVFDRPGPEPMETCVGGAGLARVLDGLSRVTYVRSSFVEDRWPPAQERTNIRIRKFWGHEEIREHDVADPPGITDEMLLLWPLRDGLWERTLVRLRLDVGAELRGGCASLGASASEGSGEQSASKGQ